MLYLEQEIKRKRGGKKEREKTLSLSLITLSKHEIGKKEEERKREERLSKKLPRSIMEDLLIWPTMEESSTTIEKILPNSRK